MSYDFYKPGYNGQDIHIVRNDVIFNLTNYVNMPTGTGDVIYFVPSYVLSRIDSWWRTIPEGSGKANVLSAKLTANATFEGISLGINDGTLCASPSSTVTLYNFHIVVLVYEAATMNHYTDIITVHVHESLSIIKLTPSHLQLRPDTGSQRFGVLAEFTSTQVVGGTTYNNTIQADISFYQGLQWAMTPIVGVQLKSDNSFAISATPPPAPSVHDLVVTVTAPTYLVASGATAPTDKAGIEIKPNLSSEVQIRKYPAINPSTSFQVLITGDGFTSAAELDVRIDELLNKMATSTYLHPWNNLKDSITFWRVYFPSDDGCCTIEEPCIKPITNSNNILTRYTYIKICDDIIESLMKFESINRSHTTGSPTIWTSIPPIILNNYTKDAFVKYNIHLNSMIDWSLIKSYYWQGHTITLSDLIGIVGYPVASDEPKDLPTKMYEWLSVPGINALGALIGYDTEGSALSSSTTPPSSHIIKGGVFEMWKRMINQKQLDHTKTALDIRVNGDKIDSYNFNSKRLSLLDFNKIIGSLSFDGTNPFFDVNGIMVPSSFGGLSNGHNILILLNCWTSGKYTAMNLRDPANGNKIMVPLMDTYKENKATTNFYQSTSINTTSGLVEIPQISSSYKLTDTTIFKCIHEFSHNFLADEYGERRDRNLTDYPAAIALSKSVYNLQADKLLRPGSSTVIDPKLTKWNWPRIWNIGIVSGISGAGPQFIVTLSQQDTSHKFKQFDLVILRSRLLKPHAMTDTSFTDGSAIPNTKYSGLFIVSQVDATGTILTMDLQTGQAFMLSDFPSGSLLLGVHLDSTATPANIKLESMIHSQIMANMDAAHEPLVKIDNTPNKNEQLTPNSKLLSGLTEGQPSISSMIVGLYAGGTIIDGLDFDKGIYHGAGICIMRAASAQFSTVHIRGIASTGVASSLSVKPDPDINNYMCPVCRYILVDGIDPLQHAKNNDYYTPEYPVKKI